jgi:hypothetical protein
MDKADSDLFQAEGGQENSDDDECDELDKEDLDKALNDINLTDAEIKKDEVIVATITPGTQSTVAPVIVS